jgi:PAS domain S-box-containing protein
VPGLPQIERIVNMTTQSAPKILVVDDVEDNVTLLSELLEREGYKVAKANDGLNGLEMVRAIQPDLILCDVMMPGINGFQLTQRLRADNSLGFIPIILITARNDANDKVRALEAGADDFMVKPIQRLELVARVRSLIRLKQSSDAVLAAARENAYLYQQAEQRATELSVLNEIALGIGSKISLNELLRLIIAKSCELIKAESGTIYLFDEGRETLTVKAGYSTGENFIGRKVRLGEGVAGLVGITGKPMRVNNYYEWSGKAQSYANETNITAVLGVPLVSNGEVVGVVDVMSNVHVRVFTDEDVRLLNLLAPQAGVAVNNAVLYEAVSQERDRLQAVLDSVNDGILMMDRNYSIVLSNPRFNEMMKLPPEQVVNHNITEVADILGETLETTPLFSADYVTKILRELSVSEQRNFQQRVVINDPRRRDIEWSGLPVLDSARNVLGWLNVFHDITQQYELERVRDDFINMLVHDLRSPLTSIIGGVELATSLVSPDIDEDHEHQREFLDQVSRNCYSLLNMINTLLEVSRLEADKMPLTMQEISVEELISSSINQVSIIAQEKQTLIVPDVPKHVMVNLDIEKMRRVIVNLLSNAVKFSPSGLDVRVTARVEDGVRRKGTTSSLNPDHLRQSTTQFLLERGMLHGLDSKESEQHVKALLIAVSDDGPGIPQDSVDRIFDKFVQLPGVKDKTGSGLGLAFCKLVAQAHGGRVWAESSPGHGSTFYLSIPCVVDGVLAKAGQA